MTAFCRRQASVPEGQLIWEIRSVNHRYLDIHLKLPDDLRGIETGCRERINARLGRGRIDANLRFEAAAASEQPLQVNIAALDKLQQALTVVATSVAASGHVSALELLRWPGVLEQQQTDLDNVAKAAQATLEEAVDDLCTARSREGSRLGQLVAQRIDAAEEISTGLRAELPNIEEDLKTRWQRRIEELGEEIEPARLAQEQALLLTRTDVIEELDRLDTHLQEVQRVLDAKKPAGRRLDFLMQELNREANTLGSKSSDLRTTNASVELKVLIDQMREQIQNIE